MRIYDGDLEVAVSPKPQNDRVLFAYRSNRTADYLLWITTEGFARNFDIAVLPESRPQQFPITPALQPNFVGQFGLRIDDPLDPRHDTFGPYREYLVTVEQDKEYTFSVHNGDKATMAKEESRSVTKSIRATKQVAA